jgi:cytochrome P450
MSREEIIMLAGQLIGAGSETTVTALSGAIFQLLQHPAEMKKLTEEIRTSNLILYDFTMVSVNNRYQISALGVHGKTRTKPICSTAKQYLQ